MAPVAVARRAAAPRLRGARAAAAAACSAASDVGFDASSPSAAGSSGASSAGRVALIHDVGEKPCARCDRTVPRFARGFLCDVEGCAYLVCTACHPSADAALLCPRHEGALLVHTRAGVAALMPTVPVDATRSGAAGGLLAACLRVVEVAVASVPASSAGKMNTAVRFFEGYLGACGASFHRFTADHVVGYVAARCAQSVEMRAFLPEWFPSIVLASTALDDVSALRRYASVRGWHAASRVFAEAAPRVSAVGRVLRGPPPERSSKIPILIAHVRAFFERGPKEGRDAAYTRDKLMLILGLVFGLRRSEIVALRNEDVSRLQDGSFRLIVRFDKTTRSVLNQHQARVVVGSHRLLDDAWAGFVARFGADRPGRQPLFARLDARGRPTGDALAAASVSTAIREAVGPGPTAHSLRVGCATELAAAGVDDRTIMQVGRWRSLAALHYVLPVHDRLRDATRSMGDRMTAPVVQRVGPRVV